ncbi:MAG: hypothetical protein JNL36_08835 [Candidatus Kapabacteria bacterium]|jgi:hypothetical protein|nr:hypothetical protein [Candidatus Kapabacteria bacterium]
MTLMKQSFTLIIVLALIVIVGCAKEPPEKLLINLTKKTTQQLTNASTGKEAGEAIIAFAKEISIINKQYPSVKESISTSEYAKEFDVINTEFVKSVSLVGTKFGNDKDFQKALEDFSTIAR